MSAKNKIKEKVAKIKEKVQEKIVTLPKKKKILTKPIPLYKNQLADASKENIKSFYGRIVDQKAAKKFGAKDIDEFSFWSWRSCGILCLQMIIRKNKKTMEIIKEGLKENGYIFKRDIGWKYKTLANILKRNKFKAKILKFLTLSDIALSIQKNRYVILSVRSQTGGHLILIFGFKTDKKGKIKHFFYYDPMVKPKSKFPTITFERLQQISKNQGLITWKQE